MARNRPDKESRRRVEETSNLRDSNSMPTPQSSLSLANTTRTPSTASPWRQNTGNRSPSGSTPSSGSSFNKDLSVRLPPIASMPRVNSTVPRVPARVGNDAGRINHALEPLLQAAGGNESQHNAAAERFPGQILEHLNTILERQQALNKRLKQRIMAVEEQGQNGQEKKTSKRLPKALTVR